MRDAGQETAPDQTTCLDESKGTPSAGGYSCGCPTTVTKILKRSEGQRISWETMLNDVQALGLTNSEGNPIENIGSLKKTFQRVRAFKLKQAEAKRLKAAGQPKRPTNTPPRIVHPAQVRPWTPQTPNTPTAPDDGEVDRMTAQFRKRSGWRG